MSTVEAMRSWLDRYGMAWEDQDADAAAGLFTEDGVYAWGPFSEPIIGRAAIHRAWRTATSQNQEDTSFGYELLAITEDGRGIARWWASMIALPKRIHARMEGIFLIQLDERGSCVSFREWWNEDPPATGASDYE